MVRGEATELFARERGDGLETLLGNLDQMVFGDPANKETMIRSIMNMLARPNDA